MVGLWEGCEQILQALALFLQVIAVDVLEEIHIFNIPELDYLVVVGVDDLGNLELAEGAEDELVLVGDERIQIYLCLRQGVVLDFNFNLHLAQLLHHLGFIFVGNQEVFAEQVRPNFAFLDQGIWHPVFQLQLTDPRGAVGWAIVEEHQQ